jgi:transcriptional regulator with XRE-family HTH domain
MGNGKELIAQRLKLAREISGLTQSQVAKIIGLHRPSISEIEAGRRNVTPEELLKFSEMYSVDVNWIVKGSRDSNNEKNSRIELAARELAKLKDEDLNKIMDLLVALKQNGD